ncbi:MAG: hypothetical protein RIA08_11650 [Roseovarius sp.]|uniref:hypothetical protein n=1 Tax=Roseovarius sp. TaxID=1486281 RepID=UPI0032EDF7E3
MQDRTINNALLALRRQGGSQGKLADVLLELRGVDPPRYYQNEPAKRGQTARFVLDALKDGPKTCPQIADMLALDRPDLVRKLLLHRVYNALCRLEVKGRVRREGQVWKLAP